MGYPIANFSGLLEIMFGLNSLVVLFDIFPALASGESKLLESVAESTLGRWLVHVQVGFFKSTIAVLGTLGALGAIAPMIYEGFNPKTEF